MIRYFVSYVLWVLVVFSVVGGKFVTLAWKLDWLFRIKLFRGRFNFLNGGLGCNAFFRCYIIAYL